MKDVLYTLRWYSKAIQEATSFERAKFLAAEMEAILTKALGVGVAGPAPGRETPAPDESIKATLVLVVGHEKRAPGASFALGGSEYDYNTKVAALCEDYAKKSYPGMVVKTVFRDGVGISGAYATAKGLNPDACIELHFNAFNGKVAGTETLSTVEDKDKAFAKVIQKAMCKVFGREGDSRGVKVIPKSARGGGNIYSLPGFANCLVEPFFGDNREEAEAALSKQQDYARALIDASAEHFKALGLV
mgnify:CR=1 FL=1